MKRVEEPAAKAGNVIIEKRKRRNTMNNKAAKGTWAAAFTVASVWFGTHVGGGFASGNQVVKYFAQYGMWAAVLPIIAMGILALVMYTVMKFAKLSGFTNYKDTFAALYPKPWMEVFFEIFYIVILLAAVGAAVAGAGEVLANFFGIDYTITANKILFNLIIVAVLIVLSIFGVKLVIAASTVLSIAILISTAAVVIAGVAADFDTISANLLAQNGIAAASYVSNPAEAIWSGVIVYAAFQCVSIPAMIAAGEGLTLKGIKRANILGWLMNGLALAASAGMLSRWYPLLKALQDGQIANFTNAANGIPNQSVLTLVGIKWLMVIFSILLFSAFVSTSVTLVFTMIQRFQGYCFPKSIKSEKVRGVIVGVVVIGVCFAISMLGLSDIINYAYRYDGYYAILVIFLPVLIWGLPKVKKLSAAKKAELE